MKRKTRNPVKHAATNIEELRDLLTKLMEEGVPCFSNWYGWDEGNIFLHDVNRSEAQEHSIYPWEDD